MGSKVEDIIEHVNISYEIDVFREIFEKTTSSNPLDYLECGAQSWTLNTHLENSNLWKPILQKHSKVHSQFCELATGFNFSKTNDHTVPPHVDIDRLNYYNLLLPVWGAARIEIFKTNPEHLEFRHGLTHWMMLKNGVAPQKIGELIVDKPTLLNTNYLHSVQPIVSPRCVWCTRWVDLPLELSFKNFKQKVEETFNA